MTAGRIALAIGCVIALVAAAFVRKDAIVREGRDLKPRPDALEYGLGAASFARSGRVELELGGAHYPLRYPPGFPILAAPYVAAAGGAASATWRAAFTHGVAAVPVITLIGWAAGGPVGACFAALVAITSPLAIANSVLAMSETTSELLWALVIAALLFAVRSRESGPRLEPFVLAGVALGLGVTVRYTNLALIAPALLFVGTRHRFRPARAGRAVASIAIPALIGVAAILLYQWRTFGAPGSDGYSFWVPEVYRHSELVFSTRYLLAGIPGFWAHGHLPTYGRALLGSDAGIWISPWLAALALVGLVRTIVLARSCGRRRLLALVALVAMPAVLVFHLFYFWQDTRFLVPLLPCLAALAGSGAAGIVDAIAKVAPRARATMTVVAALGAVAWFAHAADLARFVRPEPPGPRRVVPPVPALVDRLAGFDRDLPRGALVIVNFPATIAEPALGAGREILLSDADSADPHLNAIERHDLRAFDGSKPRTQFLAHGATAVRATVDAVQRAVDEGRPVFFLECANEGAAGGGIAELRSSLRFDEVIVRQPVTVWSISRRPPTAR